MVKEFRIAATSDRFWNKDEFIKFLFQNQNCKIHLSTDPEAVCLSNLGIYDILKSVNFQDVMISTCNPLEKHDRYHIQLSDNWWFSHIQKIPVGLHQWNQSKIFYALFHRPTASRLAIASYLKTNYAEMSHIHFSADTGLNNLVQFEFDKLLQYDIKSMHRAANLLSDLPLLLSSPERYTIFRGYDYSDPLTDFYRDIFVDVVVESHVMGNTFFPTEKTLRPMWLKKPFIVFASRDYLCYLRQMGFKTFFEFWDEDYDGYETRDRLLKILHLLDEIASLPVHQLSDMYQSMRQILDHNYNILLTQKYNKSITKIE